MTDRKAFAAVLIFLLISGAAFYVALQAVSGAEVPWTGDRIGVLQLDGVIGSGNPELSRLERLTRQESVKGLVVEIRSPGGTVGGSQSLYEAIRRVRESGERSVVAWIGEVGASGGYYAALGADSVLALPGSITGSIGVIMQFPDVSGLLDKAGVRVEIVKSGELKDMGSTTRPLEDEERRVFQDLVDDVYGQFVNAVAANRSLDPDSVRVLADGRIYSGERAVRAGLVDRTATLEEAIRVAGTMAGLGPEPDTVHARRPRQPGLLDILSGDPGVVRTLAQDWLGLPVSGTSVVSPRLMYLWQ